MPYFMFKVAALTAALSLPVSQQAGAQQHQHHAAMGHMDDADMPMADMARAVYAAPLGVMGDHLAHKGKLMLSYRFMHMDMGGNRVGRLGISAEEIVTTVPNRFFGMPGQPPTLRIVPTVMDMDMHMVGAMYAPSDKFTFMAMGMLVEKTMQHVTFAGPAGGTRRGEFTTRAQDIGDVTLGALVRLYDDDTHHFHLNAGVSVPTGTQSEEDDILTPMGGNPTVRLPYPMQIGTGTWDLMPGATYRGYRGAWHWGAQYRARLTLGDNSDGYAFGDKHTFTTWAGYGLADWVSASLRLEGTTQGTIDGRDPRIMGPVQTANPDFQGGEALTAFAGLNFMITRGAGKGHRFAIELGAPLIQDLNGPQMETNWVLMAGWRRAF